MTHQPSTPENTGRIAFEGPIASKVLGTNRIIRIYLPPSYERDRKRRFPVLYVQDGQNAFTTAGDHVAFGWGNWQLDKTVDQLASAGKMREIIMVAIDCAAERYREYLGPSAVTKRGSDPLEESAFQRYTRFLMDELKPKIDREYRTLPGASATGSLGSSMGGICSMALAWEHPRVFGCAASLSGAFQVDRQRFVKVMRLYEGRPRPIRVYLDSGVIDYTGGDDGRRYTDAVAQELRRIGWRDGVDLMHWTDDRPLNESELAGSGLPSHKWKEAQTSQHNEFYWRLRAWRALTFLFPPAE